MGKNEIREPTQNRSIEKKEKIIKIGFKVICQKGYYNTNTAEIAKEAGVSTGIVYQYFKDKEDIFLQGVEQYAKNLMFPIINITEKDIKIDSLENTFLDLINSSIKKHNISKKAHEEIVSLQHSNRKVEEIFENYELEASNNLKKVLSNIGVSDKNLGEKSHVIISLIDSLCHEVVYHRHKDMDSNVMKQIVIGLIIHMLES